MHCPRCGQQQVSEEIKYCSRCGFSLALVAEVLAHGGTLPELAGRRGANPRVTRNSGLKVAAVWFMLLVMILLPLAAITGAPEEVVASLAVIGACGALVITALSFLFLKKPVKEAVRAESFERPNARVNSLGDAGGRGALPPTQSVPASAYVPPPAGGWRAPETADLAPHSVTDGTTRLLEKEEK